MSDPKFVSMRLSHPALSAGLGDLDLKLPDGCVGVLFVWESKDAAREWYDKDVQFAAIEETGDER
jgi:hypothetical protein